MLYYKAKKREEDSNSVTDNNITHRKTKRQNMSIDLLFRKKKEYHFITS